MKIPKLPQITGSNPFKSLSQLELILLFIFVIYLVLPIDTPELFSGIIDSPLGMLGLFFLGVYFLFTTSDFFAHIDFVLRTFIFPHTVSRAHR
jgi:hypothetical protein